MFNLQGQVIGINTAIYSPTGGSVGIGFAIPSNLAKGVVDQLISFGSTKRGWIGVSVQEVTDDIAESLGITATTGALVAAVTPDGPAAKAGIKQGDIILSYNNKPVAEMRFLPRIVAESPIGTTVPVVVHRQGKDVPLMITPGQLEKARQDGLLDGPAEKENAEKPTRNETKIPGLALSVAPVTDALRARFNLAKDINGLVVTSVVRDGDAAQKGVMPGDIILEINQKQVTTPRDVLDVVMGAKKAKKNSLLLLVNSQSNLRFVAVKLAE
jgi:serine protease Do